MLQVIDKSDWGMTHVERREQDLGPLRLRYTASGYKGQDTGYADFAVVAPPPCEQELPVELGWLLPFDLRVEPLTGDYVITQGYDEKERSSVVRLRKTGTWPLGSR